MSRLAVAKVAHHLQAILDDLVFVGGCAAALLVPPPADANLRPTDDVDCVMSITSYAEFSALEMKLRELGCTECRDEGAPYVFHSFRSLIPDCRSVIPALPIRPSVWVLLLLSQIFTGASAYRSAQN